MKEARIECLCKDYRVSDLRSGKGTLVLRKGDVIWLSEAEFLASESLAHAKRVGAVGVQWRERCQREKPIPTRPTQRKIVRPPPPVPLPTMGPQEPSGDTGKSKGSVVREAVQEALEDYLAAVPEPLETPDEDDVETPVEEPPEEFPSNLPECGGNSSEFPSDSPDEYECPICDKVCKTQRGLSMHMKTHVED